MDLPAIIDFVAKYTLVPSYYSEGERELAIAMALLGILGWILPANIRVYKGALIGCFVVGGVLYAALFNMGGIYLIQLFFRGLFFLSAGALFSNKKS